MQEGARACNMVARMEKICASPVELGALDLGVEHLRVKRISVEDIRKLRRKALAEERITVKARRAIGQFCAELVEFFRSLRSREKVDLQLPRRPVQLKDVSVLRGLAGKAPGRNL